MGRCETVNEKRKGIWKTVVLAVLFMSAQVLLKEDGKVFAVWWLTILVLGWCSFPLCQYLFSGFRDRGYLVAKIFGIAGAGFLTFGTAAGMFKTVVSVIILTLFNKIAGMVGEEKLI